MLKSIDVRQDGNRWAKVGVASQRPDKAKPTAVEQFAGSAEGAGCADAQYPSTRLEHPGRTWNLEPNG